MAEVSPSKPDILIKSILVIDDHPLYCDALASAMKSIYNPRTIKTATTLAQAVKALSGRFKPDLVMLDLNLPDVTGLSGFEKLKNRVPDVPVVVISATSSNQIITALLSAGAAGFIPKECPREVLEKALRQIWEGKIYTPPGYQKTKEAVEESQSIQHLSQKIASLTPQQSRILQLVCEGKLNKQIAYEMSLAEATVKAHVTAMLRKLNVHSRTQAALLAKEAAMVSSLK